MKPYGYPKGAPWSPRLRSEAAFLWYVFGMGVLVGVVAVFLCR